MAFESANQVKKSRGTLWFWPAHHFIGAYDRSQIPDRLFEEKKTVSFKDILEIAFTKLTGKHPHILKNFEGFQMKREPEPQVFPYSQAKIKRNKRNGALWVGRSKDPVFVEDETIHLISVCTESVFAMFAEKGVTSPPCCIYINVYSTDIHVQREKYSNKQYNLIKEFYTSSRFKAVKVYADIETKRVNPQIIELRP